MLISGSLGIAHRKYWAVCDACAVVNFHAVSHDMKILCCFVIWPMDVSC